MKLEYVPATEIGRKRQAWFKAHSKPGLTMDEYISLNEEALRLLPISEEESRLKTESLMATPEFVL
jgi:hypothetical protein